MKVTPLEGKAKLAYSMSTATINAYEGAVRSGKTVTTLLKWIRYCMHGPLGTLVIVGKTERTAERNVIDPIRNMLGKARCEYNKGLGIFTIMGRVCVVIGANDEGARSKIQGTTYSGAYVDEAATVPESFFNMLTTRLSVEGAQLFCTMNPEGKNHWMKKKWLDKASLWVQADGTIVKNDSEDALDLHRFTFILDDNAHNLPKKFVENLKKSYTGVWYKRFILSQWTNAEGAIFDMWDETKHVIRWEDLPPMKRLMGMGVDYGTQNATAAGIIGWGQDDKLYIVDEWKHVSKEAEANWTDAQLSTGLRDFAMRTHTPHPGEPNIEWYFLDPSAASLRAQLFYDGVSNVARADNDVLGGIRTVASLLVTGKLLISDRCTGIMDEIPEYTWDPVAALAGVDKPKKQNDHSMDGSLRYPVQSTRRNWAHALLGEKV